MKNKQVQTDPIDSFSVTFAENRLEFPPKSGQNFLPCIFEFLQQKFDSEIFETYASRSNGPFGTAADYDKTAGEILSFSGTVTDHKAPLGVPEASFLYFIHKCNTKTKILLETFRFFKVRLFSRFFSSVSEIATSPKLGSLN